MHSSYSEKEKQKQKLVLLRRKKEGQTETERQTYDRGRNTENLLPADVITMKCNQKSYKMTKRGANRLRMRSQQQQQQQQLVESSLRSAAL